MDYENHLNNVYKIVENHVSIFGHNSYEINILPGWVSLAEEVLSAVENRLRENERLNIVEIKEKMGRLKIYFGSSGIPNDRLEIFNKLFALAELKSLTICSTCGKQSELPSLVSKCEIHSGAQPEFTNVSILAKAKHEDQLKKLLRLE